MVFLGLDLWSTRFKLYETPCPSRDHIMLKLAVVVITIVCSKNCCLKETWRLPYFNYPPKNSSCLALMLKSSVTLSIQVSKYTSNDGFPLTESQHDSWQPVFSEGQQWRPHILSWQVHFTCKRDVKVSALWIETPFYETGFNLISIKKKAGHIQYITFGL